jgi:hypothetical protein
MLDWLPRGMYILQLATPKCLSADIFSRYSFTIDHYVLASIYTCFPHLYQPSPVDPDSPAHVMTLAANSLAFWMI